MHWNTHMIHRSKDAEIPGRPDQISYLHENNGYFDYLHLCHQFDMNDLNLWHF